MFSKLSDNEMQHLEDLPTLRRTLARAELMEALARIRLTFAEQAEKEILGDPWLRDQEPTVRTVIMASIAETRATEYSRLAEAQVWLRDLPSRIDTHSAPFANND